MFSIVSKCTIYTCTTCMKITCMIWCIYSAWIVYMLYIFYTHLLSFVYGTYFIQYSKNITLNITIHNLYLICLMYTYILVTLRPSYTQYLQNPYVVFTNYIPLKSAYIGFNHVIGLAVCRPRTNLGNDRQIGPRHKSDKLNIVFLVWNNGIGNYIDIWI